MNKERLYKHNGYGFGYDSDFNGSCLTIVKSKKDTLEVLTNIFGESANAINGILENQQQELEKYKNIVNEAIDCLRDIRQSTFIKYNSNEWNNCLSFNDDIKPLLDKLKELKGE